MKSHLHFCARLMTVAVLCVAGNCGAATQVPPIHIFSAGSLRVPLKAIAHSYTARTGVPVEFTFGSSGLLRERIEKGADADVFASADVGQPQRLAHKGGWHPPIVFARNSLCLISPKALAITPATALATLLKPTVSIGTSTPHADPSGDYTWQMFHKANRMHPGAYAILNAKAQKLVGGPQSPKLRPPKGRNALAWLMAKDRIDVFVSYCSDAQRVTHAAPQLKLTHLPPNLAVHATSSVSWREPASPAVTAFVKSLQDTAAHRTLTAAGFIAP